MKTWKHYFTEITKAVVAGLLMGLVFGLVALGLTIIFGVMDIVNFAHGEFLMVGMYAGFLTATVFKVDPLFGLPVAAVVGFAAGDRLLLRTGEISPSRAYGSAAFRHLRLDALPAQS